MTAPLARGSSTSMTIWQPRVLPPGAAESHNYDTECSAHLTRGSYALARLLCAIIPPAARAAEPVVQVVCEERALPRRRLLEDA
jgi:hypothetical protein